VFLVWYECHPHIKGANLSLKGPWRLMPWLQHFLDNQLIDGGESLTLFAVVLYPKDNSKYSFV
jgi:hypothetical protein